MTFATAIFDRQRAALVGLVAVLFAMAGIGRGGSPLTRTAHLSILRVLRSAESALRRLIFVAAEGVTVKARAARAIPENGVPKGASSAERVPAFPLFDPRKQFSELNAHRQESRHCGPGPRLSFFDDDSWTPLLPKEIPSPDLNPDALARRLKSMQAALDDLPRQARRMIRVMARREKAPAGPGRYGPLRPGHPPGHRERRSHPVDDILAECHLLAHRVMNKPPDRRSVVPC